MIGIRFSGTAKGWFGLGKTSAIVSTMIVAVLLISVIIGIVSLVMDARGETDFGQTAASDTLVVPTPAEPTPASQGEQNGSEVALETNVVEITAKELITELLANPDRYERGTVFQVSGIFIWELKHPMGNYIDFFIDSEIETSSGKKLGVSIRVFQHDEEELFKAFNAIKTGDQVVAQGTHVFFSANQGISLENCSLISVTPAR